MAGVADVDDILNALGRLGKYQVKQIIVLQLTILSLTFHVLSIVFTGYLPDYTCKNVSFSAVNSTNSTINDGDTYKWREYGQCTIKTFTNTSGGVYVNETGCTDGWTYQDFRQESSFATEWNLVCERDLLTDLTQTLYNVGQSIGGVVFTSLSDRYGRKPIHVACHVALFLVTLTTAFIPAYAGLAFMRLVTGALQEGTGLTAAVMVLEFAPKEIRGLLTTLGGVYWSTGIALVTPIAYLFRNHSWRHLQICLALLTSWSLIEWWLIDESLRWLIANGKITQAKVIIKQACKVNQKDYVSVLQASALTENDDDLKPQEQFNKTGSADTVTPNNDAKMPLSDDTPSVRTKQYTILDLIKSKRLLIISIIVWFAWITNSLVYYCLFLMSSSLAGNRFLNFFLESVVEYPATLMQYLMINRCGRKWTSITFHAICGAALLIASVFITLSGSHAGFAVASTAFTLIGKFAITGSFNTIFLYTPELYPTNMSLSGHCSHIVGLLKTLQALKLHNYSNVPEHQSCTSVAAIWGTPRGSKIKPVPINHVVVARPAYETERKRKPVLCQVDTNYKVPKVTDKGFELLAGIEGTPLASRLKKLPVPMVTTPMGQFPAGSALSYQTRNLIDKEATEPARQQCGNTNVNRVPIVQLPHQYQELKKEIVCEDPQHLEEATRYQATSDIWHKERQKRVTASTFGKILLRKSLPSDKFVSNLFSTNTVFAKSLDYGKRHEKNAKEKYLATFPSRHLHECGLVVNNEFPFLGASPDGKVCIEGETGIIEIKCPYSARSKTITESCEQLKDFCLEQVDEKHRLKRGHEYYCQVQGQLMITGCEFCEFIVFTQKDLHVERIVPDTVFMEEMLRKLANFYKEYAMPYLNKS